jgi:transposase
LTEAERERQKQIYAQKIDVNSAAVGFVLASARKESARRIARTLGCDDQTVRNVIKKFNATGLDVLKAESREPHDISARFIPEKIEQLKDILHQSPRNFGKETSLWTLNLLAEVSVSEKVAERW